METRDKALEKAESAAKGMESRKLKEAARCLREGIGETTTHLLDDYPREHRRRIRTNNMIERLNREIRRRTRVVGSFPDGNSALRPICARVRYATPANGRRDATATCQGSVRTYQQRTDHHHRDGRKPKCAKTRAPPTVAAPLKQ